MFKKTAGVWCTDGTAGCRLVGPTITYADGPKRRRPSGLRRRFPAVGVLWDSRSELFNDDLNHEYTNLGGDTSECVKETKCSCAHALTA